MDRFVPVQGCPGQDSTDVLAGTTGPLVDTPTARADLLRVAGAGVLWGTGGLAGSLLARSTALSPLAVACYRLLIGGLLLTAALAATGRLLRVRRDGRALRRLAAFGLLAALYQSCYFAAVALTSVSLATLVTLGATPVLVVAADAVLTRRRPSATLIATVALALAGLGLLVGSPGSGQAPALGTLLALGSGTGFAAITLLGRRQLAGLDPVSTTAGGSTLGGLLLAAVVTVVTPAGLGFAAAPTSLALAAYLGVVPTAVAYVLYFGGLRTVRPGPASLIALLEPLTAAVLGAVLLGDRLGLLGGAGALLIGIAVVLCRRQ
jgi:DME family drug/metabolite transporter